MKCPACRAENLPDSVFCEECAAPLEAACPACGAGNRPAAKFCRKCRAPLIAGPAPAPALPKHLADKVRAAKSALEGERKQVTVLFADVKGSMELAEQLDPEEWSAIMQRFFGILSEGVERFEGFVDKFTGDGIMALFGAPIAHEDHAQRACYAALHLRDELRRFAQELRRERGLDVATRIGLNSGEVVVGRIGDDLRMDYTAQGHTVGLAHGRSIPLRPVLEMFRQRFGITERDTDLAAREKIAGALLLLDPSFAEILPAMFEFMGVPDPARPAPRIAPEAAQRRMLEHVRRIVKADTRDRTVVTLIEDLHWLDDASDRFVAELVEIAPATRMLLLLNFRPEYTAEWTKRSTVQQIALQPLGPEAVREMLAAAIGDDPSVRGLPELIHARTGGNPFFAEEIVQALIEDGSLAGATGAYRLTREIEKVPLPEKVEDVLDGRLE